jgi:hypothetical protein
MYPNRPFCVMTAPTLPETTEMLALRDSALTLTSNLLALTNEFVAFVLVRD